jgi:hypothetical protein
MEDMGRECRKEAGLVGKVLLKRYLYRPGESFGGRFLDGEVRWSQWGGGRIDKCQERLLAARHNSAPKGHIVFHVRPSPQ